MASQEEDQTEGEGRDGRDRDGDRLSQWEDNAAKVFLGTEPNAPLYYAMGLEHYQPIMSTLGDPGGQLYIYIYSQVFEFLIGTTIINPTKYISLD